MDSVRAEYDKSRYKAYPRGGKWCTRTPCCSADDAWRRDTVAFPDSRIICQRPSDTKNSKSILSYVPLSARDRRSFANNVADRRVPEVSDLSPFLLFFFPSLFFYYQCNQSNISHTVIERGEDLYRKLKRSWFVESQNSPRYSRAFFDFYLRA